MVIVVVMRVVEVLKKTGEVIRKSGNLNDKEVVVLVVGVIKMIVMQGGGKDNGK